MAKDKKFSIAGVRTPYLRMLCDRLAEACDAAWSLVTIKSSSKALATVVPLFQNDTELHKVVAAAAVGNLPLFRQLLQGGPRLLWEKSYAFGYPLAAAAAGNHFDIVKAIIKRFESVYRQHPAACYEVAFSDAIEASLTRQNFPMSKLLFDVYCQYFPVVPSKQYEKWVSKAVLDSNEDVLLELATLRTELSVGHLAMAFKMICKTSCIDKIKIFFEKGFLDINQGYPYHSCPLNTAVIANKYGPVEELLRLGADPDGVFTKHPRYLPPLWYAIDRNNFEIVQALLNYGANPHLTIGLWESSNRQYRNDRADIEAALEEALFKPRENYHVNQPSMMPRIVEDHDAADLGDLDFDYF